MNQSERQFNTDQQKRNKNQFGNKKKALMLVVAAVATILVVPVLAWFYFQRSLQTITMIDEPLPLEIGAGDARDITELELSNIDVTEKKYHDVVFCVYSSQLLSYNIQLAHTTNIGFSYTIYPAQKTSDSGLDPVKYMDENYYIDVNQHVDGKYLNLEKNNTSDRAVAVNSGVYHNNTYGSYNSIQTYAEPLYWKNNGILSLPQNRDERGYYINYYVLRISWDNTVRNNKETDMVYLMAEATGAAS